MRTKYNKKVFQRKRAKMGKKFNVVKPKINGRLVQPVHYFKRHFAYTNIVGLAGTTTTFGDLYFQLDDLPNYSEFTTLYDFYKILAVKVYFIPISNVNIVSGTNPDLLTSTTYGNRMFTVIDYNDRTVPTSLGELRQYNNCKVTPNEYHTRFFHPRPVIAMDEDAISGGVYGIGQTKDVWVSTESNQCEWYGLKYGIEHLTMAANTTLYKTEVKVYLAFKAVK